MKCYICGGKTTNSKFAHICQQEYGPCGWIQLNHRKLAQDNNRANSKNHSTYWEKTRFNHVFGKVYRFDQREWSTLLHICPSGIDTIITDKITEIDDRHVVEFT